MLYNTKWEKLYTLPQFAAWLAQQPKHMSYQYNYGRDCAAAQYLQAHGVKRDDSYLSPQRLRELGWDEIVVRDPGTFGAAAARARKTLRRQAVRNFFGRLFGR